SAGGNVSEVEGTPFTFAGSVSGGAAPYTYFWNFGDGSTATGTLTPTHTYTESGTFTVLLAVTDAEGILISSTATVTVPSVAPTVTISGPSVGNVGSAVTFVAAATDPSTVDWAAGFTYNWIFGDGTSGSGTDQLANHTYSAPGTYSVSVTATDQDGA